MCMYIRTNSYKDVAISLHLVFAILGERNVKQFVTHTLLLHAAQTATETFLLCFPDGKLHHFFVHR